MLEFFYSYLEGEMKEKLLFILCTFSITIAGIFYVDYVCAEDADFTGHCGVADFERLEEYDEPIGLPFTHEEYVEYYQNEEGIYEEAIIGEAEILTYTNEELELLAHLIFAEAGSDWCSDKMQQYTGSVVLNRIKSKYYPNNMHDVIYQKGQYSVVNSGAINKTPNQRAYDVAKFLLENGSVLPENVIFQSQHIQGDGIYEKVQNMYFCYKN